MKVALTACFAATVAVTAASAWAQETAALQPVDKLNPALMNRPAETYPDISYSLSTRLEPNGAQSEVIPAGVPLRVQLDKSYLLHVGASIEGHLVEPVYLVDHVVLPANSQVFGTIIDKKAVGRQARTAAVFNGDLTPLKEAQVTFNEVRTPDGSLFQIETNAIERSSNLTRVANDEARPHRSLGQRIAAAFRWTKTQTVATLRMDHKSDKLRQMLYEEIPVHPQELWAGTQYDAELTQPVELIGQAAPAPTPTADLAEIKLNGTIEARLVNPIDSGTAHTGTPVEAVLTQPLFQDASVNASHGHGKVLLPEGTRLLGAVVRSKSAGLFGRNGSLRLTFRKAELPAGDERAVRGQLTAAETEKGIHIQIDDEGGAKATSGMAHFLTPVSMGSLAAVGNNPGTALATEALAGNGMDMLTRVVGTALSNGGLVTGFAYYEAGKVVYDQWIARGHDVVFPRNTRVEIELAQR